MSDQITTAMVKQYERNVDFLVQQKGSRLRPCVRVETGVIGKHAYYDQIGQTDAQLKASRHGDTPLIPTPHERRRVTMYDYEWADLIDEADELKILIEPRNKYAMNAKWAMQRGMDARIIAEVFATAYTGEEGGTAVTWASVQATQRIVNGGTGLTLSKLRTAKEILDDAEVDDEEPRFMAVTPKQVTNLLETTEATSTDYATVKALVQGEINTFMGFNFIRLARKRLNLTDASGYRRCFAWAQNGILLAEAQGIKGRITERADKSYSTQVFNSMSIGATRMEEDKIVEIVCVEA